MYTTTIDVIYRKYDLDFQLYVDDQTLFITFKPGSLCTSLDSINQLQLCIAEMRSWMRNNMLKLNDKTEFMIIGTKQQFSKLGDSVTLYMRSLDISP